MWEAAPLLGTLLVVLFCALQKRTVWLGVPLSHVAFCLKSGALGICAVASRGSVGSPPFLESTCVAAPVLFAELRLGLITGAEQSMAFCLQM